MTIKMTTSEAVYGCFSTCNSQRRAAALTSHRAVISYPPNIINHQPASGAALVLLTGLRSMQYSRHPRVLPYHGHSN